MLKSDAPLGQFAHEVIANPVGLLVALIVATTPLAAGTETKLQLLSLERADEQPMIAGAEPPLLTNSLIGVAACAPPDSASARRIIRNLMG